MKLFKKLTAMCSALAMAATMFAAVTVQAADAPVVALRLDEASEGVYNLVFNVDTTGCELGSRVQQFQFGVYIDSSKIEIPQIWDEDNEMYVYDITYGKSNYASTANSYVDNVFAVVWNTGTANGQAQGSACDMVALNGLKLKDGVETEDVEIYFTDFLMNIGANTTSCKSYGIASQKPNVVMDSSALTSVIFPGNKTSGGEGDDTPSITKVGSYADGANDNAVAYMYETTAVAGNTVTATGTITFADDTTKTATLSKAVNANVEGAVALGIIVQFDGTWKDFVITEMAIN